MGKLNVYVPDDLARRVQAQGESINISLVCRVALEAELRRVGRQRQLAELDTALDIPALRRHFLKERAQHYHHGYELGLQAAAELPYATFRFYESIGWNAERVLASLPEAIRDRIYQLKSTPPWHSDAEPGAETLAYWEGALIEESEGFADALHRAWDLAMNDAPSESVTKG